MHLELFIFKLRVNNKCNGVKTISEENKTLENMGRDPLTKSERSVDK